MKAKFILGLIPLSAVTTLIASGFSAWSFGGNGSYSISSISVIIPGVKEEDKMGEFSSNEETLSLILDQSTLTYTKYNGASFEGDLSVTLNPNTNNDSMLATSFYKYTFSFTFTILNNYLLEYLDIKCEDNSLSSSSSSFILSDAYYVSGSKALNRSEDTYTIKIKDKLSATFKEDKKPEKESDYNTMKSLLDSSDSFSISINYIANSITLDEYNSAKEE